MGNPYLREKSDLDSWIGGFRPNSQARLRLFCFPYAGGTSVIYRNWLAGLPDLIDVCPVHLPGRNGRLDEQPFNNLVPLVEAAGAALYPYLGKPFALFGHSMGARISFELTRLFRRQNWPMPLHMFVSGSRAPQVPDTDPPTYDLPEPEFIDELRRLNGTPRDVLEHPELMQLMIPLLRADFEVCQTYAYTPEPPLKCPITAFGGLQDVDISREDLEAWRIQTTGQFTLRMLPGDHFFLHAQEPTILQALSRELYQIAGQMALKS
jgi:medium-chain acyl-[acyl-carrier-protein] hydrolase